MVYPLRSICDINHNILSDKRKFNQHSSKPLQVVAGGRWWQVAGGSFQAAEKKHEDPHDDLS